MKLVGTFACLLLLAACGGASNVPPPSVTTSSAASVSGEASQPAAEPAKAEAAKPADTLAAEAESAPLPKLDFTPESELRKNTRAKLESALKSIKGQTTANGVNAALTRSLGKPNWVEDDSKRVWVATDSTQCVRLVLESDGSTNLEVMRFTEAKVISSKVRQNLCTGQIERDE